jgi:hypothetical protein
MRQDCKHFESRTYGNGETVRKCSLDLAPEAPWRCPADCDKFTRRLADVNWSHGNLVTPETPAEPKSLGEDDSIAALLDAAEDIVNNAVDATLADIAEERRQRTRKARWGQKRSTGRSRSHPSKPKGESWADRLRKRYRDGQ